MYKVRLYDGFDNEGIDVSKPVSREEAEKIWLEKTKGGTKNTCYNDIDSYVIEEVKMAIVEANCKGSYILGSACGKCHRCNKELQQIIEHAKKTDFKASKSALEKARECKMNWITFDHGKISYYKDVDVNKKIALYEKAIEELQKELNK
jgi:hypothetical protein